MKDKQKINSFDQTFRQKFEPLILTHKETGDTITLNYIDVEPYEEHFTIAIDSAKHGKSAVLISKETMDRINAYYWDITFCKQKLNQKLDTRKWKKPTYRKKVKK